jgi:hypothetical protein
MEDDKTPAAPRKRAAKAKPTGTSSPAEANKAAQAGRPARPRKIPPAMFVPPVDAEQVGPEQIDPAQQAAAAPGPAPTATGPRLAKKSPRKVAKKAPAAAPAPSEAPQPAETPPATPAPRATKAPAKKITNKAAPLAEAAVITATSERPATPPKITASTQLWPAIKANPGYATELLALAAVGHLGPLARTHVTWLRERYPTATAGGLARIAASGSVRQARTQGAVAGLLGPLAVFVETPALLWTQARLVLGVAAAYGRDPADPERAVELLALLGVHPDLSTARQAVAAARAAAANGAGAHDGGRVSLPLVRVAGRALTRMAIARQATRVMPGAGAALTWVLDGQSTERLAARATKFYRGI